MKVACDFCERIARKDSSEVCTYWTAMSMAAGRYMLCKDCSEKMWAFIVEQQMNKEKEKNANGRQFDTGHRQ